MWTSLLMVKNTDMCHSKFNKLWAVVSTYVPLRHGLSPNEHPYLTLPKVVLSKTQNALSANAQKACNDLNQLTKQ